VLKDDISTPVPFLESKSLRLGMTILVSLTKENQYIDPEVNLNLILIESLKSRFILIMIMAYISLVYLFYLFHLV
jgi:hypothetical protein